MSERITELIESLYERFGSLNPFTLVDNYGIELHYVPFGDNPMGQYVKILGTPTILLNDKLENSSERIFVLGHELHHALEHESISSYYMLNSQSRSKMEQEANKFAVHLCYGLYIEENGWSSFTKSDLELLYGVPLELSEVLL